MPDISAGEGHHQKSHEGQHAHYCPGVHQKSSQTIPTRYSFNFVMHKELFGAMKYPRRRLGWHVGSCGLKDTFYTDEFLSTLWAILCQVLGDLPAGLRVQDAQGEIDELVKCDRVVGDWCAVTQSAMPPGSPGVLQSSGLVRHLHDPQRC